MNKISLLSKIYIWSVALELLLFFRVPLLGRTFNISRFLQVIVLIGVTARWFLNSKPDRLKIINFASPLYRYYALYFVLAVFAGVVGILSGAYHISVGLGKDAFGFVGLVRHPYVRVIVEYVVTLYYFLYFVVLPYYILKTKKGVGYFLSILKVTFIICFVAGIVDFVFSAVNLPLLSRSLDEYRTVGVRFHGFAGEPRDAFIYLFFGLGILHLEAYYKGIKLCKWWIPAIAVVALSTYSFSGIIGLTFFAIMYLLYVIYKMNIIKIIKTVFFVCIIMYFVYICIMSSERTIAYFHGMLNLWNIMESGAKIPYPINVQIVNIYPIYNLIVKLRNFNILPILTGLGLGTSSILNNKFFSNYVLRNTNAQIIRLIYETGIVGVFLFILAFIEPVKYLTKHILPKRREEFILIVFLLLGCLFAHRHAAPFVYLGVFIAVFRVSNKRQNVDTKG